MVNSELREYKKSLDNPNYEIVTAQINNGEIVQAEIRITEDREEPLKIPAYDISDEEWQKYKAARNKKIIENPKWEKARDYIGRAR